MKELALLHAHRTPARVLAGPLGGGVFVTIEPEIKPVDVSAGYRHPLGRLYPGAKELENGLVVAVTETVTDEDVEALARALEEVLA